jgi:hypothetical protein
VRLIAADGLVAPPPAGCEGSPGIGPTAHAPGGVERKGFADALPRAVVDEKRAEDGALRFEIELGSGACALGVLEVRAAVRQQATHGAAPGGLERRWLEHGRMRASVGALA